MSKSGDYIHAHVWDIWLLKLSGVTVKIVSWHGLIWLLILFFKTAIYFKTWLWPAAPWGRLK